MMCKSGLFAALLGLMSLSVVLAGDVSGTWALEVQTPTGKGTPTATLKQDGESLSGRYAGKFGESDISGTIKGTQIDFVVHVNVNGNKTDIRYSGTLEAAETMKGTVAGGAGDGTWTAKKK
jgi:hypothetical protein